MSDTSLTCYSYNTNLIDILANKIIADNLQQLPFLNNIVVLLPNYKSAFQLQEIMGEIAARQGFSALFGLEIFTLNDYIQKTTLLEQPRITTTGRELVLINALQQHNTLFGEHNLLTTANALLELFDELTKHQLKLPENLDDFIQQLENAYQCDETEINALSREARIIHTLWHAWHEELNAQDLLDAQAEYLLKIAKNLQQESELKFYIAGYYDFLPAEISWLKHKLQNKQLCALFQGEDQNIEFHPSSVLAQVFTELDSKPQLSNNKNSFSLFLDAVFDNQSRNLLQRSESFRELVTDSPAKNVLQTYCAHTFENEATAIEIQVRTWLSQGKNNIALLLEDRRLARRVRARLEQSGIGLIDRAGWALSTSAAAAVLESWLQCIEENFHYIPLLDVIKSPFVVEKSQQHLQTVYRLEQDIVRRENVLRDLKRLRQACEYRAHRLNQDDTSSSQNIILLFDQLQQAAQVLMDLHMSNTGLLSQHIEALLTSLKNLGAYEKFSADEAGLSLINLLEQLLSTCEEHDVEMDWISFRHWLGFKLEEATFTPSNIFETQVELLHLSQTVLSQYDALIIGNMTQQQYPGAASQSPFFNQSVRHELGLATAQKQQLIKFYHFRRVLESAPNILLSYHQGDDEALPSAWLSLIESFHQLCYASSLHNAKLHQHVLQHNAQSDKKAFSNPNYLNPAIINKNYLPEALSASTHQSLINCPYAFFAGSALKLKAPDEIKELLSKSDYGNRVHLCLEAFHAGEVKNIAGPYNKIINSTNRQDAINFLTNISEQVFSNDLEDNFQHRGWFKRWKSVIPEYIDWQINRSNRWQFKSGEIDSNRLLVNNVKIKGRIDRVDENNAGETALLDYKTGKPPSNTDVINGEAVQLLHYALSNKEKAARIEFLEIETSKKLIAGKSVIEHDELLTLTHETEMRLGKVVTAIREGAELPAWGEKSVCSYCQFTGLCRRNL